MATSARLMENSPYNASNQVYFDTIQTTQASVISIMAVEGTQLLNIILKEEELVMLAAAAVAVDNHTKRVKRLQDAIRQPKARSVWTREWILERPYYGQYEKLVCSLKTDDVAAFSNFLRIDPDLWHEFLERVGPRIERSNTVMREALTPGHRLAITLRYMATGDSYMSLQYGFRVAHNTISGIVFDTCSAICEEYMEEVMKCCK